MATRPAERTWRLSETIAYRSLGALKRPPLALRSDAVQPEQCAAVGHVAVDRGLTAHREVRVQMVARYLGATRLDRRRRARPTGQPREVPSVD